MEGPARKPRAPRAPKVVDDLERLNQIQTVIYNSLDDDKAEDIVVIDLVGRAAFVDRMIIATGLADRQIVAMASHLEEKLREIGIRNISIEGTKGADWVLVDVGDIIVHLFKPEARGTYGLEKMWAPELDENPRSA